MSVQSLQNIVETVVSYIAPTNEEAALHKEHVQAVFESAQKFHLLEEESQMVDVFFQAMNRAIHSDFERYHQTVYAAHIRSSRELICQGAQQLKERPHIII